MTILTNKPLRDITPEEVREFIRRAHADRAAVMRQTLASLLWWRRKTAEPSTATYRVTTLAHEHK
jgi:hypothetical protein